MVSPLVSVVIPSFNHEPYIGQAIESVLSSTIQAIELIVVDDGSTDGSVKVVQNIKDSRIRLITQTNKGTPSAINRGVELAKAPWISILNSDDVYHPKKIEAHLEFHHGNPLLEASASRVRYVNAQGFDLPEENESVQWYRKALHAYKAEQTLLRSLYLTNHLVTTSCLFLSKQVFNSLGGFKPLRYVHDWFMFLSLAERGRFDIIDRYLVDYRMHGKNTVFEDMDRLIAECHFVLEWHVHNCVSGQEPSLSVSEANELIQSNPLVNFKVYSMCQYWREECQNDLQKVIEGIEHMKHPLVRKAISIICEDRKLQENFSKQEQIIAQKDAELIDRNAQLAQKETRIAELEKSTSWRITAPMRYTSAKIKNVITRFFQNRKCSIK